jgi:WD40 repeat protein
MIATLLDRSLSAEFVRHRGPVGCVAAIPNSSKVLTASYDGAVGVFDLDTGMAELLGYHHHLVNRITVSPSSTKAASSSSDYTVYIWDLGSRQVERVLRGHSDDVDDFVFIDDETGASVSQDCRILIWDLRSGAILRILEGHEKDVISVASLDGRLYTCGDDKTLRVWDIATGKLVTMWGPFDTETDTCAIDRLHRRAVLGCDDGCLRFFDIERGAALGEVQAHAAGIKKVAVSPANGDVLSAAYDQRVVVWDAHNLHLKVELERKASTWERSVCWSADGSRVLAGTFDGTVLAWDAHTGRCLTEVGDRQNGNVCFNDASGTLAGDFATVSDDGYVRLGRMTPWEAKWLAQLEPAKGRVLMNAVTLDEASGRVACGTHDHHLLLFDKVDDCLQNERTVCLGEGPINSVRIASHPGYEGDAFVACYSGAIVRVTRGAPTADKIHLHDGAVKSLRLHPDKPLGISCSSDGLVAAWDFSGELVHSFVGHMAIADDVDLDPSGRYIVSVSRDFTLKVFDLTDGRLRHSVRLGRRSPKSVCFVDERMVIVGNYWGELIQVRLPEETVVRKQVARNGISSLTACAGHLLAVSYDGGAYLVRSQDLAVVQTLRGMTQRLQESAYA